MADYGLWTWAPGNVPEITPESFTVRVVYSGLITATFGSGYGVNVSIPGVSPATHSAICIPVGAYPQDPNAQNAFAAQFEPQVIQDGVAVFFKNRAAPADAYGAQGTQRLIVMRDR